MSSASQTIIYKDEVFSYEFIDILLDLDIYPEYSYPLTVYKKRQKQFDFVRFSLSTDKTYKGVVIEEFGDYEYMGDYPLESPCYNIQELDSRELFQSINITDIISYVPMDTLAYKAKVLRELKTAVRNKTKEVLIKLKNAESNKIKAQKKADFEVAKFNYIMAKMQSKLIV